MRIVLCVAMLGILAATPVSAAQRDYNGRWTIVATTERGNCVPGFRINVRVFKGKAYVIGRSLSGTRYAVSPRGQVNIRYVDGSDVITISGILKQRTGAGRWSFPTYRCTGQWRAKRR